MYILTYILIRTTTGLRHSSFESRLLIQRKWRRHFRRMLHSSHQSKQCMYCNAFITFIVMCGHQEDELRDAAVQGAVSDNLTPHSICRRSCVNILRI